MAFSATHAVLDMLPLIERSVGEHAPPVDEAGQQRLVRPDSGWIEIFREPGDWHSAQAGLAALEPYGLRYDLLSTQELLEHQPGILGEPAGTLHWLDSWTVTDPGAFAKRCAALFQRRGSFVVVGDAASLHALDSGWSVRVGPLVVQADTVVVALGSSRGNLLAKRGYYLHFFGEMGALLQQPLCDSVAGYVLAPMTRGLCLTTGAEFAAPPNRILLGRVEDGRTCSFSPGTGAAD